MTGEESHISFVAYLAGVSAARNGDALSSNPYKHDHERPSMEWHTYRLLEEFWNKGYESEQ